MSVWAAVFWGGFTSASLYLGQLLAGPMARAHRAIGLVMGFGAGTLLSAVAYELIPESSFEQGLAMGVWFLLGALTYFIADTIIDARGGKNRQRISHHHASRSGTVQTDQAAGTGVAMFLGALLDGIPEAFILGVGIGLGGSLSIAFVTAVFVSNVPQGVAGTTSLEAAGYTGRHVFGMWTGLTIACAAAAGGGYVLADALPDQGLYASAFAAGAVLSMLADSMMPEAFKHGGRAVGLLTVVGYLVAAALSVAGG
jgi:ZIP family zinc transporter